MENEFLTWLGSGGGIAFSGAAGVAVAFASLWFMSWRKEIRKWEGEFGAKLNDLGFPSWFTAPFIAASQGDKLGAAGDAIKAIQMAETHSGKAEIAKGLLLAAKADPARWAAVKQIVADVEGGVDPTADIEAGIAAGPWGRLTPPPRPLSVLKSDIHEAAAHIKALGHPDPVMTKIADSLQARGLGHLLPVVAAAVSAAAPPLAAPVAAAGALLSAAGNVINVPDGHSVTVTPNAS